MERFMLKASIENFITIGLFSATAYLGIVGAKMLIDRVSMMKKSA